MRHILIALVLVLVVATFAFAGQRGIQYGIHTIHGMKYDRAAIEKLLDASDGPAEVTADERGVQELKGKFKLDKSMPVEEAAVDFIDRHRDAFKLKYPKKELKLARKSSTFRFQQTYNDLPVFGKEIIIHVNKDWEVDDVTGNYVPTPNIDTTPLVTKEEALAIAKKDLGIPPDAQTWPPEIELMIYSYYAFDGTNSTLVYRVNVSEWMYFIDAKTGGIINKEYMVIID